MGVAMNQRNKSRSENDIKSFEYGYQFRELIGAKKIRRLLSF